MNWLDIVILVIAGGLAVTGMRVGGIQIAVTAAGIFAGIALGSRLQDNVAPHIIQYIDNPNGADVVAFIIVFTACLAIAITFGMMIRSILRRILLGWADQISGLSVGTIAAFVIGSGMLSVLQEYPIFGMEIIIEESMLGTFLADNFDTVLRGIRMIPAGLGN